MDLTHTSMEQNGDFTNPKLPLYHNTRTILGLYDLVVSFKTNPCTHNCNFCEASKRSKINRISDMELVAQVDFLFDHYANERLKIQRVTVRNESSVLDGRTFYYGVLREVIKYTCSMPNLKEVSLETRMEYVTKPRIERILEQLSPSVVLDITTGFETQDERILNMVLNKGLNRRTFEKSVQSLGQFSGRTKLTAYVMLKPDPSMTEEAGVEEAVKSVDYLQDLTQRAGVNLVVYVNPTYAAPGSRLFREMQRVKYQPPTKESLQRVMDYAKEKGVMAYTD